MICSRAALLFNEALSFCSCDKRTKAQRSLPSQKKWRPTLHTHSWRLFVTIFFLNFVLSSPNFLPKKHFTGWVIFDAAHPMKGTHFLRYVFEIYMLRLYHQGCTYVLLKPHEKESNISIITFGQILIVGYFLFIKHEICSISFLFLLGAAIVFCTYCYVKPLRYLIIRKN